MNHIRLTQNNQMTAIGFIHAVRAVLSDCRSVGIDAHTDEDDDGVMIVFTDSDSRKEVESILNNNDLKFWNADENN